MSNLLELIEEFARRDSNNLLLIRQTGTATGYNFCMELTKKASEANKEDQKSNIQGIEMIKCEKCGGDAFTTLRQISAGDERTNTVFICPDCGIDRIIR